MIQVINNVGYDEKTINNHNSYIDVESVNGKDVLVRIMAYKENEWQSVKTAIVSGVDLKMAIDNALNCCLQEAGVS